MHSKSLYFFPTFRIQSLYEFNLSTFTDHFVKFADDLVAMEKIVVKMPELNKMNFMYTYTYILLDRKFKL